MSIAAVVRPEALEQRERKDGSAEVAYYDQFSRLEHPAAAQRLLVGFNRNLIGYLQGFLPGARLSVLEIGPGRGYFCRAALGSSAVMRYAALDQNRSLLAGLGVKETYVCTLPEFPAPGEPCNLIYAAFVVEHLANGRELYRFLESAKSWLAPGGILALQVPDFMRQREEFWNLDYTHSFPTTKRNITMALAEHDFSVEKIVDFNGLLTHRLFHHRPVFLLQDLLLTFYQYRLLTLLARPFFRTESWRLENPFYRLWGFAVQNNFLCVSRRSS